MSTGWPVGIVVEMRCACGTQMTLQDASGVFRGEWMKSWDETHAECRHRATSGYTAACPPPDVEWSTQAPSKDEGT